VSGNLPPVVVLAFHVDYWDYNGWKDPFASSAWTVKQKAYVEALRLDTLFTPQVVIGGRTECVGTDLDKVAETVRSAPRFTSPAMQVSFIPSRRNFSYCSLQGKTLPNAKMSVGNCQVIFIHC
jgi:hypothetical protein